MKKRIITLLAVLALLVTCAVFAVQADGETYTSAIDWTAECPCGCLKEDGETPKTLADIEWTTWEEGMAWEADGHYLVTGATFTESPAWGTSNLTILLRSTADPAVDPDPVTMTMAAKAQFCHKDSYVVKNVTVSIFGEEATIESQLADTNGGMFRTAGGTLNIKGDVTLKGTEGNTGAGNNGGLIGAFQGTVNLDGVTMYQVTAKSGGGCLYSNTGKITANNCKFIGVEGATAPSGGAVRLGAAGSITLENCTVENTKATTGGFAYVSAGTLTVRGTTVTGCDATTGADNIYMAGGTVYMQNATINTGDTGVRGNGVYIDGGTLRLHQKSDIVGPDGDKKLKGNIAIDTSKSGVIEVSTGWTGTSSLQTFKTVTVDDKSTTEVVNLVPGKTMSESKFKVISWDTTNSKWIASTATGNTATSARLYAENVDALCPRINFYQKWFLPFRATVMDKDGNLVEWALTTEDAIVAANKLNAENSEGGYYGQLQCSYSMDTKNAVTGVLDLNGFTANLRAKTGSQLTVIDSAASQAGATVALMEADEATDKAATAAMLVTDAIRVGNKLYITKLGETEATIYPVEFKISSVSLRAAPTKASMYYTATVTANEVVGVTSWGVAVTLNPNATALNEYLYTVETEVNGAEYNGVLINGIVTTAGEGNADRADDVIYAKAYITIGDETLFSTPVAMSLNDVVAGVMAAKDADLTEPMLATRNVMQTFGWYTELYATAE